MAIVLYRISTNLITSLSELGFKPILIMAVLYFLKTYNLKQNVIKSVIRIVFEKPQRIAQYLCPVVILKCLSGKHNRNVYQTNKEEFKEI